MCIEGYPHLRIFTSISGGLLISKRQKTPFKVESGVLPLNNDQQNMNPQS